MMESEVLILQIKCPQCFVSYFVTVCREKWIDSSGEKPVFQSGGLGFYAAGPVSRGEAVQTLDCLGGAGLTGFVFLLMASGAGCTHTWRPHSAHTCFSH